ncbi:hypothetical protein AMATHDRAFT_796 [Amanita thiersii Skay4041]|uniref:Uncharacterized protein n=1 Tax=Amanita thiersii Skay4041 TaxID=703135 RepID=A0A2A9NZE9_9AGAR|nr:hypothetical protein AMATHDRAFT_796 [Amanita thiersii Skay4041]
MSNSGANRSTASLVSVASSVTIAASQAGNSNSPQNRKNNGAKNTSQNSWSDSEFAKLSAQNGWSSPTPTRPSF